EIDGRLGIFVGGLDEIRLPQSRCGTIYEAWLPSATSFGDSRRLARNNRWHFINFGVFDATHSAAVCDRDAGRNGFDQDPNVSGNLSVAVASSAAASRLLGRASRDPIGIRTACLF